MGENRYEPIKWAGENRYEPIEGAGENTSLISYQKNIEMIFDQTSTLSWLFASNPYNWGHANSYVTLDVWNLKATSPFSWREHQLSPSKANVVYLKL